MYFLKKSFIQIYTNETKLEVETTVPQSFIFKEKAKEEQTYPEDPNQTQNLSQRLSTDTTNHSTWNDFEESNAAKRPPLEPPPPSGIDDKFISSTLEKMKKISITLIHVIPEKF